MKKVSFLFICYLSFFLFSSKIFCQNNQLDSLFKTLPKSVNDTGRIRTLGQISEQCDFDDILKYCNQILDIAEKNKTVTDLKSKRIFLREKARAYNNIGFYYYTTSKVIDGLDYYQKGALILEKDSIDSELLNSLYNNIAGIQMQIEETDKALTTLRKCLKIDIMLKNTKYLATDYNNLSGLFGRINMIDSALYYGLKSIEVREAELKVRNDIEESTLITYYTNVGGIYLTSKHDVKSAEKCIDKAFSVAIKKSDTSSFSAVNYWKGQILLSQKKYMEAKPYLEQALNMLIITEGFKAIYLLIVVYMKLMIH